MRNLFIVLIVAMFFSSCTLFNVIDEINDNTQPVVGLCDEAAVVDANLFLLGSKDYHVIDKAVLIDNCLEITFSASGCSGSSWKYELVDAGDVMESNPIQRNARLVFSNPEMCEAYFSKTVSFDISALKCNGDTFILHLKGYDKPIVVE